MDISDVKKVAIMQPYFFPYLGYFQLIDAVDTFVFYDDVSYIKSGWINRNRIKVQGLDKYVTVPVKKPSHNQLIKDVEIIQNQPWKKKMMKSIRQNYSKAKVFDERIEMVENIINSDTNNISSLAIKSVIEVCKVLNIDSNFKLASKEPYDSSLFAQERVIHIVNKEQGNQYINLPGGRSLYDTNIFADQDIQLSFIKSIPNQYDQIGDGFIPNLSILDVLFNNTNKELNKLVKNYSIEYA